MNFWEHDEVYELKLLWPQNLRRKACSEALSSSHLEEPIRAELFSSERLEQHAESLAAAQPITATLRADHPLLPRVLDNGQVLLDAYRAIAQAIRDERAIIPAAEWLVDNFHILCAGLKNAWQLKGQPLMRLSELSINGKQR